MVGEAEGEAAELGAEREARRLEEEEDLGGTPDLVLHAMVTFVIQKFLGYLV